MTKSFIRVGALFSGDHLLIMSSLPRLPPVRPARWTADARIRVLTILTLDGQTDYVSLQCLI